MNGSTGRGGRRASTPMRLPPHLSPPPLLLLLLARGASTIHWPGFGHGEYGVADVLPLRVAKLTSIRTQIPFSFYSLAQCVPQKLSASPENIGEVLHGDRILNAPYELRLRQPRFLALCRLRLDAKERAAWVARIRDEYRAHLLLDNLPVATRLPPRRTGGTRFRQGAGPSLERGYRLGTYDAQSGSAVVNNHLRFIVQYYITTPDPDGRAASAVGSRRAGGPSAKEAHDVAQLNSVPRGGGARIVGFEVVPSSRAYTHMLPWPDDFEGSDGKAYEQLNLEPSLVGLSYNTSAPMILKASPKPAIPGGSDVPVELIFTYEVEYEPSDVPYSSRWDVYLRLEEGSQVHWVSLLGSLSLSLLLAGIVGAILLATVRRDLRKYNAVEIDEEVEALAAEIGWKYIHADVLRPPRAPLALSCAVGAAAQLWCCALATLSLAMFGLVSPTARGRLLTAALLLLGLSAVPAGYVAARTYRQMTRGQRADGYMLQGALSFVLPGGVFASFTLLDVALWAQGASSAVPFSTMAALLLLWCAFRVSIACRGKSMGCKEIRVSRSVFISLILRPPSLGVHVPLLSLGVALGFRVPHAAGPIFTNQIARVVPTQPAYLHPILTCLVGGLLPFGTAAIELSSLYASAWNGRVYFLFGFLFLMVLISTIVCIEVSILLTYLQLCWEDYRWWWRSFFQTASSAVYFFGHATSYAHSELHLKGATAVAIYYGYTTAAAAAIGLMTGALGFLASFWFVRTIYAAVKLD